MYEVEIKAALGEITAEETVAKACSLGFSYDITLKETDTYYNGHDRNFMKTDEALRIRSCLRWHENNLDNGNHEEEKNADSTAFLTYKGPKLDKTSSTRTEYEITVDDAQTAGLLIDALGYSTVLVVDKTRREFTTADGTTLCIDNVEGLPAHIELEALVSSEEEKDPALSHLLNILSRLGIPQENMTRKSYLEMLLKAQL